MVFTPPPVPATQHTVIVKKVHDGTHGSLPLRVSSHQYNYVLTGNTLLPDQVLEKAMTNSKTPRETVAAIRSAYFRAGYFLVALRAELMPNKIVRIEVYQGQITKEKIPGSLKWFFPGLRYRANIVENDVVYRSILASAFSQRNGQNMQIGFQATSNPGGSELHVGQTPQPGYQQLTGNVFFGNYGGRYSSRYLTGGSLSYSPGLGLNFFMNGNQGLSGLTAASAGSNYSNGQVGLSSITPWGIYTFSSQWTHYHLGNIAYPLSPTGNIFTWTFNGNQLIYANAQIRWSFMEGFTHVNNKVKVYQSLIPGGYPLTVQDYNYFNVGTQISYAYTAFGKPGSISGNFNYNQGINGSSGTLNNVLPGYPAARFHYFDTGFTINQSLPFGLSASLSANGQGSFNTLPSQQQWVLGGFGNLSAWYPGIIVGDSGYSARAQLLSPAWDFHGFTAQANLFTEAGGTHNIYAPGSPPWQSLSDAGVGVNLQSPWGTHFAVISAVPVGWNHVTQAVRQSDRVDAYFVISQNF